MNNEKFLTFDASPAPAIKNYTAPALLAILILLPVTELRKREMQEREQIEIKCVFLEPRSVVSMLVDY
jgi:hypothetical protein